MIESLHNWKKLSDIANRKRESRMKNRFKDEKSFLRACFGIKPVVDYSRPLSDMVKYVRKHKKTKDYTDSDGRQRCTKLRIVTKAKIEEMVLDYRHGKSIRKLSEEKPYSFYRISRMFTTYGKVKAKNEGISIQDVVDAMYPIMNEK